jgi:hypothetical protein
MKLTNRQKVLLAVFFVGALALVVDRIVLRPGGGPEAASADASGLAADPGAGTEDPAANQASPRGSDAATLLNEFAGDTALQVDAVRDPFALPGSWREEPKAAPAPASDPATRFRQAHRLTAVVLDEQTSYVLLDDRLLVPGHAVDGFALVAVRARSAVFERDGQQVVLELQEQAP